MSTTLSPLHPATASVDQARRRSDELERLVGEHPERFRVLTGDRPTGPLHLGHNAGGRPLLVEPEALLSAAPRLLGTDGAKMSKSGGNAITLRAGDDETARLVRGARTDAERRITYDPPRRPEVSNLVLVAAVLQGRSPETVADEIGDGGAAALKRVVIETVNEHLRPLRRRRRDLAADPGYLRDVLAAGNERANVIADTTLASVREAMGMTY